MGNNKSLLRWAGGKSWFINAFKSITGNIEYEAYYEPFLGGASIFLSSVEDHLSFLSDINGELIDTYTVVRDYPEKLVSVIKEMRISELDYYYYRDEYEPRDLIESAARFIYLNHFSYNGIYRVNSKGKYNVPFGKRTTPYDTEIIKRVSIRLKDSNLANGDFNIWKDKIKKNDLVFLDPPYSVSSNIKDNGFIGYNKNLFSLDDQNRLKYLIDIIKEKGAYYILTNAFHPTIKEIFENKDDVCIVLNRKCLIGVVIIVSSALSSGEN